MLTVATAQVLGCTPCECGVPGACAIESQEAMISLALILVISVLARFIFRYLFKNLNSTIASSFSVIIGYLFSGASIDGGVYLIYGIVIVMLTYTFFSFFDLRKRKTSVKHAILGGLIVFGLLLLGAIAATYLLHPFR
jgi:hypothetical protein